MSEGKATAPRDRGADPLIGRVIADRFRIVSLIARGGMGRVYRAEQAPLGRLCAIKVLNPNYNGDADPEFHRRFFREASITSRITHPNSVTIFDYGVTDDDIYFMAMEYLEGKTLHLALREGGVMHEVRAGRIASQICRALREAHNLGVIHRDLKPANIFLTRPNTRTADAHGTIPPPTEEDEDFVKVLDFGLVKQLGERPEEQLTQTGLFMGSPKYMAPEQIQGGHVDERTDIYSLGIIMYEMLAGKVPFERATSVNILMAHVGEPPPPMREVNPNLLCSPAFEEIVMSCIAKNPNDRLSSMDQVIQAIRRAHGGSLTGQIAAVHGTGPQQQQQHYIRQRHHTGPQQPGLQQPPPWVPTPSPLYTQAAQQPMRAAYASNAGASGSHAGLGAVRGDHPSDQYTGVAVAKPRSKIWVIFGVLVAAGVGGGLGMLAFHWTTPAHPIAPTPTAATAPSASNPASVTSVASAVASVSPSSGPAADPAPSASATPEPKHATLHVTSEPAGATVREDNKEVCAATPCDLVFKAEAADATKVHKLVIAKPGYRGEPRTVKTSEAANGLHVKLIHVGGSAPRPPPTAKPEATTPSGFKDAY